MSNEENHKKFVETLESLHDPDNFRVRSYSGRNMYGADCVGVTCESEIQVAAEVIGALVNDLSDDDSERADEVVFINWVLNVLHNWTHTDSMGRDHIIVYWPRINASLLTPRQDEDEEDDDE